MAAAKSPIDATLDRVIPTELGDPVPYRIPVTAYPTDSKMLLVNSPGSGELKDGREDRWKKLALQLQHRGLCTMVTYNAPRPDFEVQLEWEPYSYKGASWNQLLVESLSHTIDWSLANAKELCGSSEPVVNLAGFSSGGSAVGAVAHRYPQIQRMLLLSTYDSVGDQFYEGVYISPETSAWSTAGRTPPRPSWLKCWAEAPWPPAPIRRGRCPAADTGLTAMPTPGC